MFDFKNAVATMILAQTEGLELLEVQSALEIPKNPEMGDLAYPCFKLAKTLRKAPPAIAAELAEKMTATEVVDHVEAVAGYINFTFNKGFLAKSVLEAIQAEKDQFGSSTLGNGKKAIVEFSSTNIAKPFHMGHIRSTMIGNALYRIHQFLGYETIGINHLGDYGTQFGKLIVAYKKWGNKELVEANPIPELLTLYVKFHELAEADPSYDDEARAWFKKLEENDEEAYELWTWFREVSLKEFNRVYGMLDVHFDSYAGESFYSDKMPAVLSEMREKGLMKSSEGAEIVDLEPYGMPPALITKKDGSSLYITRDIAASIYRKNHYNFDKNIYVVGSAQKLHFQQWMKIVELMGHEWVKNCVHVEFGMVALEEGSMSTRSGRIVFLEDVLNTAVEKTRQIIEDKNPNLENKEDVAKAVGIGAIVFQELSNNRIKDYTFSWEKSLAFEGETGPYVQYTHARACSVIRKAPQNWNTEVADFNLLKEKAEVEVLRLLRRFPEVIQDAGEKYEPSLITRFIVDLAQTFNRFYHDHPILVEDQALSFARIALVDGVRQTLKNGLYLISLKAPERM